MGWRTILSSRSYITATLHWSSELQTGHKWLLRPSVKMRSLRPSILSMSSKSFSPESGSFSRALIFLASVLRDAASFCLTGVERKSSLPDSMSSMVEISILALSASPFWEKPLSSRRVDMNCANVSFFFINSILKVFW